MSYAVKEIFTTIQGEGLNAGRRAVFLRFAGCNLWDGLPEHRARGEGPCSLWCDTDFFRGERYDSARGLAMAVRAAWGDVPGSPKLVVLTGGEPGLQVDEELVDELRWASFFAIAVETNGTRVGRGDERAIEKCDHVCLSPKRGTNWRRLEVAHEVKVVLPGAAYAGDGWTGDELLEIEGWARDRGAALFVQPQDPIDPLTVDASHLKKHLHAYNPRVYEAAVRQCVEWVHAHPRWRLSMQTHKLAEVP